MMESVKTVTFVQVITKVLPFLIIAIILFWSISLKLLKRINQMKLDTLTEGYQRLCECKNGSFITSNYRVISIPKYCIISLSEAYL